MRRESAAGQFLRFSAAGVLHTAIGYAVIFGLMAVSVDPTVSNIAGYAAGLAIAFATHRLWVFGKGGGALGDATRYLAVFFLSFLANLAILQLLLRADIDPYAAQVAAAGAYVLTSFWLNRSYVFRRRAASKPNE